MIDYGQHKERLLDDKNIESEITMLEDHFKIFNCDCDLIDKEIVNIKDIYGKEKIMKIGLKFEILKEIIERIQSSVQYIRNYMNKNHNTITTITISVRSRIDEINGKFFKLAESSKKRIDKQIFMNEKTYLNDKKFNKIEENKNDMIINLQNIQKGLNAESTHSINIEENKKAIELDVDDFLKEKIKSDILKLKEIKEEYEKVLKLSYHINLISRDLVEKTRNDLNPNLPDPKIDKYLQFEIDVKDEKEKELMRKTRSGKCFNFICLAASALIVLSAVYFYLKY